MMKKIFFLGTSDSIPSARRNHSSFLLNYFEENILIDCGEGTQRQFRKARLNPCKVNKILITHWHGDHVLGLAGFLQTLSLSGYSKKLEIYGPKGTKEKVFKVLEVFPFKGELNFEVFDLNKEGVFFENSDFILECKKTFHGVESLAYNFIVKEKLRIDKEKFLKLKLKPGPYLQDLKKGKDILVDGKKYLFSKLTYLEKGFKISFVLDTGYDSSISNFVKSSDVLIIENSFSSELKDLANEFGHLTSLDVSKVINKSGVLKVFLVHISQRYETDLNKILKEVKKEVKIPVFIPKDLEMFEF
jgi:ribonuclease Z